MIKKEKQPTPSSIDSFAATAHDSTYYIARWKRLDRKRNHESAKEIALEGVAAFPQEALLHNMLGRTLRLDYTPESDRRALSAFAEAHRLNRTDVGFLVDYANFRAKQGERDEAELMLFRAYELKRPTSKIQFVIGALGMLYTPDKLDWAIACYDQCLKISPDSTFVQTNYAKVIQLGAVLKPYSWESLTHYIEWTLEEKGLHDKTPPAAANTNHGRKINHG